LTTQCRGLRYGLGELLDLAHQSDEVCEVVPESRALSLGGRGDLSEVVSQLTDR